MLVGQCAAEQQVVAGAGASHVQQALLFGALAAACVAIDEGAGKGGGPFVILFGIEDAQADALFCVDECRGAVLKIESCGQVGHYDDGKLQAFGRMDGQDVQGVRVEEGFAFSFFCCSQQVETGCEIDEGAAEFAGEVEEFMHVGHGLFPALAIAEKAPGSGVFEDGVQQLDEGYAVA